MPSPHVEGLVLRNGVVGQWSLVEEGLVTGGHVPEEDAGTLVPSCFFFVSQYF